MNGVKLKKKIGCMSDFFVLILKTCNCGIVNLVFYFCQLYFKHQKINERSINVKDENMKS